MENIINWFGKNSFSLNILRGETFKAFKDKKININSYSSKKIYKYFFCSNTISSESITNFIILLLFFVRKKHTFLFNGLGFLYLKKKINRIVVYCLIRLNSRSKKYIFQNYRDYRFFKYYLREYQIFWIPGSITIDYATNNIVNDKYFTIVRKKKFKILILKFIKLLPNTKLNVFSLDKIYFDNKNILNHGFKNRSQIYANFGIFIYFYCYGDGFPKSIVESLVNNKNLLIDYDSYIFFGIYKFKFIKIEKLENKMIKISVRNLNTTRFFFKEKIFGIYRDIIFT